MNRAAANVTVAICTWNRCEPLRRTLEVLTTLRVPPSWTWELLVVNNNCTDSTDEVCGTFEGRLPLRLLHEKTPGLSHARNLAIKEATGTYLVWTDDDVLVQEDWLAKLIEAFDEHQADWVFGPSCPEWPSSPPTWYSDRVQGNFAVLNYGSRPFLVSDETRPFFGLNFAGTMEAHLALGGFRTDFGLIGKEGGVGEDMDLFLRALRRGMRIAYTPDALVKHVIPAARATKRYQREHIWRVNRTYYKYLKDEFPRVAWSLGLPRFFFRNALGDAAAYLRGLFSLSPSLRFYHELQLVRFARLVTEAARNGFPKPTHPPANGQATHQEASR